MRIAAISGSTNFKSKNSNNVGYGVHQGADYSSLSGVELDGRKKSNIQRQITKGGNVASAKKDRVVSGIPRTLDYVKAYCPECNGFDNSDDLAQEAVQSKSKISKNSCSLDEIADMTVTIEDCQRKQNDKRSQAFYNFIESALSPEEAAVIEGRYFCSKNQVRSYNDLSKELGLPVYQVRKVEGSALKKLKEPENAQVLLEMSQDDFLNI